MESAPGDSGSYTGAVKRLAEEAELLTERTVVSIREELPSYESVPESALEASFRRNLVRAVHALTSHVSPGAQQTNEAELTLRERVSQRAPVEDIIRAYRICIGVIQQRFIEISGEVGVAAAEVLEGSRLLWSLSDAFTERMAVSYQRLGVDDALREAHVRSEFLRDLLTNGLGEDDLSAARAAMHGLDVTAAYIAVMARPRDPAGVEAFRRRLEHTGSTAQRAAIVGVLGSDCIGVMACRPRNLGDGVVGVGPPAGVAGLPDSFAIAGRVFRVASSLSGSGVFGIADLSWRTALIAEPAVSAFLAEKCLSPLEAEGEFGQLIIGSLRSFLAHDRNIIKAAAALVVHPNTLRYRLGKFTELTGLSLESTETIVELSWALESARLRGSEAERT